MNVRITINPRSLNDFNRTLKQYLEYSSRTLPEAINEKAYFIINGSPNTEGVIRLTHKADADRIRRELGGEMQSVIGKRGKALKRKKLGFSGSYSTSLAVALIIAKLRKAGKQIPDAKTLAEMGLALIRSRLRSVAFIRSGWLPALKKFARFSKYTRIGRDLSGKQYGQAKGGATVASKSQGWKATAIFWNSAGGEAKHKDAIRKYGEPALAQAFRQETASMKEYMERKMKEGARKLGIRVK